MTAEIPGGAIEPVVVARDGGVGVKVLKAVGPQKVPNRAAEAIYFTLQRSPNGDRDRVGVMFSDHFQFAEPHELGLSADMPRDRLQMACALASLGEYLDSKGLPPPAPSDGPVPKIECFSGQFAEWQARSPADDEEVFQYLKAKAYWAWRFDIGPAQLSSSDCIRLRVPLRTLARVAQLGDNQLWEATGGKRLLLKPTGELAREFHTRRQLGADQSGEAVDAQLLAPRYAGPREHWAKAQNFAHGETRDLPNAAKEAVCAVEGLARVVTGRHSDTLGDLVKHLKTHYKVDPAMVKSLEGLWGFTSNSPGVRHGGAQPATIDDGQARFVVDSSAAAIRFLLTLDR